MRRSGSRSLRSSWPRWRRCCWTTPRTRSCWPSTRSSQRCAGLPAGKRPNVHGLAWPLAARTQQHDGACGSLLCTSPPARPVLPCSCRPATVWPWRRKRAGHRAHPRPVPVRGGRRGGTRAGAGRRRAGAAPAAGRPCVCSTRGSRRCAAERELAAAAAGGRADPPRAAASSAGGAGPGRVGHRRQVPCGVQRRRQLVRRMAGCMCSPCAGRWRPALPHSSCQLVCGPLPVLRPCQRSAPGATADSLASLCAGTMPWCRAWAPAAALWCCLTAMAPRRRWPRTRCSCARLRRTRPATKVGAWFWRGH